MRASVFKIKKKKLKILCSRTYFVRWYYIYIFWGDLTDISANTKALDVIRYSAPFGSTSNHLHYAEVAGQWFIFKLILTVFGMLWSYKCYFYNQTNWFLGWPDQCISCDKSIRAVQWVCFQIQLQCSWDTLLLQLLISVIKSIFFGASLTDKSVFYPCSCINWGHPGSCLLLQ